MARRSDIALSNEIIREAAFAVLAEEGLEKLTMRSLAKRLNVQAPSIYSYYTDKSELFSEMAGHYFAEARDDIVDCDSACSWLEQFGIGFYKVLVNNRDAAMLFAIAEPPVRSNFPIGEIAAQPLVALGLTIERAIAVQAAVISLALGTALDHSNEGLIQYLSNFFDPEAGYREALGILAAGLAHSGD
jgi:TetR/AcrR family transcriptional regulator, tetracycline repressor protein